MPIADKYRLHRQVGWSDEAEVHAGPLDATHKVPVAVKIRHGEGGPARPEGHRARFLHAANEQQAALLAGCKGVAPIFETGEEGNDAFYVTKLYPRSLDGLIQGRVSLDADSLHRLTDKVLRILEDLRDKGGRTHGNLKPTNIFIDGKSLQSAPVAVGDLALADEAKSQAVDLTALGATLYQLVRARNVRHLDWPMEPSEDWAKLGPSADAWRRFCNVLIAPDLGLQDAPLAQVRQAFKKMKARANAAPSLSGAGAGSPGGGGSAPARSGGGKGLFAGLGATAVALVAGAALFFTQAGQKLKDRLQGVSGKVNAVATLGPVAGGLVNGLPKLPGGRGNPSPGPGEPAGGPGASPGPEGSSGVDATATPALAEVTPPPTPPPTPTPYASANDKWIGYSALLDRLKASLNSPEAVEQPEILNGTLRTFRENVGFQPVSNEVSVGDFLRRLPAKIAATGDQPDLPAALWTKGATAKQEEIQTITYQWGKTGFQMQFNRIAPPNGGGPAFYLSATTVPVILGAQLAKGSEAAGKLRGISGGTAPVAWEMVNGAFSLRGFWIKADAFNPYYANTGAPSADSPMNGLSGGEALQLARAAGCTLPTLKQWEATLNSPAGQAWVARWQTDAKVRSPEWSTFAKGIQAKRATGSVLPNNQCFGDKTDLSAVTTTPDQNLFFEPVNKRVIKSFAHLIGNVGQYVVDNASAPTKYYFAGGSAESAPATFQNLSAPPSPPSAFVSFADAGFRLAVPAKGDGSEKNPALDKLKVDLDAEIARLANLK